MRVSRGVVLALGIPALLILTAVTTVAQSSPTPTGGGSQASGATVLPGDPSKGETLYAQNCASCHGAGLSRCGVALERLGGCRFVNQHRRAVGQRLHGRARLSVG